MFFPSRDPIAFWTSHPLCVSLTIPIRMDHHLCFESRPTAVASLPQEVIAPDTDLSTPPCESDKCRAANAFQSAGRRARTIATKRLQDFQRSRDSAPVSNLSVTCLRTGSTSR